MTVLAIDAGDDTSGAATTGGAKGGSKSGATASAGGKAGADLSNP